MTASLDLVLQHASTSDLEKELNRRNAPIDIQFTGLIRDIIHNGFELETRNSKVKRVTTATAKFFSTPLVSVRKTAWKNSIKEWEWFMSGSSNIKDLDPKVRHWWEPWADENGEIKNNYSKQLRHFSTCDLKEETAGEVDQIELLVDGIKKHPYSRRNVITTWNTADMVDPKTLITNCHSSLIQAFCFPDPIVKSKIFLELTTYQRSVDVILGLPHNFIQMWAFLLWLADQTDTVPYSLSWIGGDCHVYSEHYGVAEKLYGLDVSNVKTPVLKYTGGKKDFKADDFTLVGDYTPLNTDTPRMIV